jgi:hypothetical protein
MPSDRFTGINGDQITDGTITPLELNTRQLEYDIPVENGQVLRSKSISGEQYTFEFSHQYEIEVESNKRFEINNDNDIQPALGSILIFIIDGNDGLMPSIAGTIDDDFEIDINGDIQPKV